MSKRSCKMEYVAATVTSCCYINVNGYPFRSLFIQVKVTSRKIRSPTNPRTSARPSEKHVYNPIDFGIVDTDANQRVFTFPSLNCI